MASTTRSAPAGAWIVRRYPAWWRERYADEMLALLEDRPADWQARLDLAHGALDAHLRGDGRRSMTLVVAALVAGGAWTLAGVAGLAQPVPLDWPGYALEMLPLLTIGAFATTVAGLGLARRGWLASTTRLELLLVAVALTGLAWTVALAIAALGGPYGALTAAVQAVAAVAAAALGVAVLRTGASVEGPVLIIAAVALLIPSPGVWLALGAGWTVVGVVAWMGPIGRASPLLTIVAVTVLAVIVAGCDFDLPATPSAEPPAAGGPEIRVMAANIAFDQPADTAPAGVPLQLVLDNRDDGVPHNVQLLPADREVSIAETEIVPGPAEVFVDVGPLPAGAYRLLCTVHPNMVADLTVE